MSLLDKFKDQFVDRDDEDMEEEDLGEETAPVNPARVRPLSHTPWLLSARRATVMRKRSGII